MGGNPFALGFPTQATRINSRWRQSISVDSGTLNRREPPVPGSLPPTFSSSRAPNPSTPTTSRTVRLFLWQKETRSQTGPPDTQHWNWNISDEPTDSRRWNKGKVHKDAWNLTEPSLKQCDQPQAKTGKPKGFNITRLEARHPRGRKKKRKKEIK